MHPPVSARTPIVRETRVCFLIIAAHPAACDPSTVLLPAGRLSRFKRLPGDDPGGKKPSTLLPSRCGRCCCSIGSVGLSPWPPSASITRPGKCPAIAWTSAAAGTTVFVREYLCGNGRGIDVYPYEGLSAEHLVADLAHFPFANETFAAVTFLANLNHCPRSQRDRELQEALSGLEAGGKIIVTMGNPLAEILVHSSCGCTTQSCTPSST